jgi:ceramide glucosyltransferase
MPALLTGSGYALTLFAAAYALIALFCRPRTYRPGTHARFASASVPQPVTVLKPLCGDEPRLEENLVTLCEQSYPEYQLLFGVRDPLDPAIAVVERLKRRYPKREIQLVVDPRLHGRNFKVSNLINMESSARHPWLVLADSDIAVAPDYLERVSAPLADPAVGIVTCLYRGRSLDTFWTRMGALFIDTWFAPSVRLASAFGGDCFGFGTSIAIRTESVPSRPSSSLPPAIRIISGTQWPQQYPGSIHSMQKTRGRCDSARVTLAIFSRRALPAAINASACRSRPVAAPSSRRLPNI